MSSELLQLTSEVGHIKGKVDGMGEQIKDVKDENVRIWQTLDSNGKLLNEVANTVKSIDHNVNEHIEKSTEELKRVKSDVVRVTRQTEAMPATQSVESWLSTLAKNGLGRIIEYAIIGAFFAGLWWLTQLPAPSDKAAKKDAPKPLAAPPVDISP